MSLKHLAVFLGAMASTLVAAAGEIRLINGDRLAGELVGISEDNILWESETVGSITISKDQIQAVTSLTPLKLRGRDEACHWQELRGSQVIFACEDGDLDFEPLYSLEEVVPFVPEGEGLYQQNGRVLVGGNRFGGNVEQQDWVVDTEWVVRYSDVRHTIGADYEGRSFEGSPLDERYQAEYAFDWFLNTRTYWQNQLLVLTDESRTIQERYAYGSGLGYEFWNSPVGLFSTELGVRYEKTIYERIPPINPEFEYRDEVGLWRAGVRFNYNLPLEISFFHRTQYFQAMDKSSEWRLESDTGFALPLGFGISANISYEYDYDNEPPETNVEKDSVLRFGLDYAW